MQLCFENEDRARTVLHNVSSLLKPGGYFFGITPDSSTIWYGYMETCSFFFNLVFCNSSDCEVHYHLHCFDILILDFLFFLQVNKNLVLNTSFIVDIGINKSCWWNDVFLVKFLSNKACFSLCHESGITWVLS